MRSVILALATAFLTCGPAMAQADMTFCEALHTVSKPVGKQQVKLGGAQEVRSVNYMLEKPTPEFQAELAEHLRMSPAEFRDMAARAKGFSFSGYEPHCDWTDHAAHGAAVLQITRPLASRDGKLLIVGITRSKGVGGSGMLCSFRQIDVFWKSHCFPTWVT